VYNLSVVAHAPWEQNYTVSFCASEDGKTPYYLDLYNSSGRIQVHDFEPRYAGIFGVHIPADCYRVMRRVLIKRPYTYNYNSKRINSTGGTTVSQGTIMETLTSATLVVPKLGGGNITTTYSFDINSTFVDDGKVCTKTRGWHMPDVNSNDYDWLINGGLRIIGTCTGNSGEQGLLWSVFSSDTTGLCTNLEATVPFWWKQSYNGYHFYRQYSSFSPKATLPTSLSTRCPK